MIGTTNTRRSGGLRFAACAAAILAVASIVFGGTAAQAQYQRYPRSSAPYSPNPYAAQIAPYATFSGAHYSGQGVGSGTAPTQSGGITALGGTFGLFAMFPNPSPVRVGVDFRALIANSANSTSYGNKVTAGFVGVRVDGSGIPRSPVVPYIQFEVGGAGTNNGTQTDRTGSFAYQVQFGGDFPLIIPQLSGRAEYGAGQLTGINNTNHTLQTFSLGLVFHLN
jgi:hypothetical protein